MLLLIILVINTINLYIFIKIRIIKLDSINFIDILYVLICHTFILYALLCMFLLLPKGITVRVNKSVSVNDILINWRLEDEFLKNMDI